MEGAVLSPSNNRFRTHLKNAASAFCTRTLPKMPKHRPSEPATSGPCSNRHHTYPRATPPKRPALSCQTEPLASDQTHKKMTPVELAESVSFGVIQANIQKPNGVKLKGTLAREVANVWGCRVGPTVESAPADRIQNLFNDIELYPTKTQVFEMLVCARQCAGRKSLTLTFGEFCVFAAELRRCSRLARLTPNKTESPQWTVDKDLSLDSLCKHVNGSEVSPPPCEVFLGGSCNPTTWRSDIAIPMLKQMGITYFNPQVEDWSTELMEVEHRAKAAARALLFVLDSETRAVAASVEAAHLAAAPRDLLLVLKPYTRHQTIGNETLSDHEYVELSRARATLQEAVERRGLPAFSDIPAALRCARAVLRGARTQPRHSLGHTILRLKRAFDAASGRSACLPRGKALAAIRDVTRAPRHVVESYLPPALDAIDFETFCAAVAELAADASAGWVSRVDRSMTGRVCRAFRSLRDRLTTLVPVLSAESQSHNGAEAEAGAGADAGAGARDVAESAPANGMRVSNARLRAYGRKLGLFIPKNGGSKPSEGESETGSGASSGDSLFTPGTERRLEKLPAMLGMPVKDVYLGGAFPSNQTRPEEVLSRERLSFVVPRANDYTRMFSAPARRAAPAHPESPRHDKKPRTECPNREPCEHGEPSEPLIELRDRRSSLEPADRLSASDFYKVSEDTTPQPFKGTYDEDLLLGSRVLVFSMSADAPCFSAMVLAAHYMGLRPNATVLLVQTMDSKLCNSLYSEAAVKDYNRGRHYLIDLARRSGVPVFDNVDDTMACVLNRIRPT